MKRIFSFAACLATMLAISAQTHAEMVGFESGLSNFFLGTGILGIENTSDGAELESLTLSFTGPTVFDTAPGGAGDGFSLPFITIVNDGVDLVTLPDAVISDGAQSATFDFAGFDTGDSLAIVFDWDTPGFPFPANFFGFPVGSSITAEFSGGTDVTAGFTPTPSGPIGGAGAFSSSASAGVTVPEPSVISMFGLGLLFMSRRRK